jgi:hypothetical protein
MVTGTRPASLRLCQVMSCQLAEIISKLQVQYSSGYIPTAAMSFECPHKAQVCRKGLNDTRRFLLCPGWGIRLAVCMRVVIPVGVSAGRRYHAQVTCEAGAVCAGNFGTREIGRTMQALLLCWPLPPRSHALGMSAENRR